MRFIIATILSVISINTFASPAATQNWVKDYVKTNSPSSMSDEQLFAPVSASFYNDDGEVESLTFNLSIAKKEGFVVTESNVSGITNGTRYAKISDYEMRNLSSSSCPYIFGELEKYGVILSDAKIVVSGSTTNVVYSTTNDNYCIRFSASINGVQYKSVPSKYNTHFFSPTYTSTNYFVLSACKLTDSEYSSLITENIKRRFSILDLIIPSAYALSPGPKIYDDKKISTDPSPIPEYGPYKVYKSWERRYYTDSGDSFKVILGDISWVDANGNENKYSIGEVCYEIEAGMEYGGLIEGLSGKYKIPTYDDIDSLVKKQVSSGVYLRLSRGAANEAYTKCISKMIESITIKINNIINSYTGKYPEEGKDITEEFAVCKNHKWIGYCGRYTCRICGSITDGSGISGLFTEHNYQFPNNEECAYCLNAAISSTGEGTVCKQVPWMAGEDHPNYHQNFRDAGPGTDRGMYNCICNCGHIALIHNDPGTADSYMQSSPPDLNCWRTWTCTRCGVNNASSGYLQEGVGSTCSSGPHKSVDVGKWTAVVDSESHPLCKHDYVCEHDNEEGVNIGCNQSLSELEEHELEEPNPVVVSQKQGDDDVHYTQYVCVHGYGTTNWCGYTTNNVEVPHSYSDLIIGKVGDSLCPPDSTYHYWYKYCGNLSTGSITDPSEQCGYIYKAYTKEHDSYNVMYGNPGLLNHDVSNQCQTCRYMSYDRKENHIPWLQTPIKKYKDGLVHVVSNQCSRTGCNVYYAMNPEEESHYSSNKWNEVFYSLGETQHAVSNFCQGCERYYFVKNEEHKPGLEYEFVSVDDSSHRTNRWCSCLPCNEKLYGELKPHNLEWNLSSTYMMLDSKVCSCRYVTNNIPHSITYTKDNHWCQNGGGHLYGPHTYDKESKPRLCTVCGRPDYDTAEELEELYITQSITVPSTCLCCSGYQSHSKPLNSETYGPWADFFSCKFGWDSLVVRCGCPACTSGYFLDCWCGIGRQFLFVNGPIAGPVAGSN